MTERNAATLALGSRKDAETWDKGCAGAGIPVVHSLRKSQPSVDELKALFAQSPSWIYFGGHFGGLALGNEADDVEVKFSAAGVDLVLKKKVAATLAKDNGFLLHKRCEVVLWGGCSVCDTVNTMRTLRTLFGPHVLLGFAGITGWRICDAILGGAAWMSGKDFFSRAGKHSDQVAVRNGWMNAASYGWGGADMESLFRAIDVDGQAWKLKDSKVVKWMSV
jgi:hypothetical protein